MSERHLCAPSILSCCMCIQTRSLFLYRKLMILSMRKHNFFMHCGPTGNPSFILFDIIWCLFFVHKSVPAKVRLCTEGGNNWDYNYRVQHWKSDRTVVLHIHKHTWYSWGIKLSMMSIWSLSSRLSWRMFSRRPSISLWCSCCRSAI